MTQDHQNVNQHVRSVEQAADTVTRLAETAVSGVMEFLATRSRSNPAARSLAMTVESGGQLGCVVTDSQKATKDLESMLKKTGIDSVSVRFVQGKDTKFMLLYGMEHHEEVSKIRELYLAAQRKVFQVDKDTLKKFEKEELKKVSGLSFSEMCALKERAVKNTLLFTPERCDDGTYTLHYRSEDEQRMSVLISGVRQEKTSTGEKIYGQKDADRKIRQSAVNHIFASPEKDLLVGNYNGNTVLYVNKEGMYYERSGEGGTREFVSRNTPEFERKVCSCIDSIYNPRYISGAKAQMLSRDIRDGIAREDKPITVEEALQKFGYRELKQISPEKLSHKVEEDPSIIQEQEKAEAYYRLQRSVDLYRTKQEGVSRPYVTQTEKEAFEAEHQARVDYEFCLNYGAGDIRQSAENYAHGEISINEMLETLKHVNKSDIRRDIMWREPYDIPDYLDQNNNDIVDDFEKDTFIEELGLDELTDELS